MKLKVILVFILTFCLVTHSHSNESGSNANSNSSKINLGQGLFLTNLNLSSTLSPTSKKIYTVSGSVTNESNKQCNVALLSISFHDQSKQELGFVAKEVRNMLLGQATTFSSTTLPFGVEPEKIKSLSASLIKCL